ncbi:MAG: type II toxin-antitoxin system VapC family toxin, partial [Gemmatimonadaceae bacterium]|nr:type II toxin-antitoxin system VapC family toxin [Gemmatimonadaceae bacterium]
PSVRFLESVARGDVEAVINAETLQEILHRYRSLKRWADGRRVYDAARQLFPDVLSITSETLDRARELMDEYPALMARDALHAAMVLQLGLDGMCSYDRDFDGLVGVRRQQPA